MMALVIKEGRIHRYLIKSILTNIGYDAIFIDSFEEGCRYLQTLTPSVAIIDSHLLKRIERELSLIDRPLPPTISLHQPGVLKENLKVDIDTPVITIYEDRDFIHELSIVTPFIQRWAAQMNESKKMRMFFEAEKDEIFTATAKTQKLESLAVLAGGIAHDFNNLLGGVYGYIEMAKQSPENSMEYIEEASKTIERARALTIQLLTFAKGGAPTLKSESIKEFLPRAVSFALSGSNCTSKITIFPEVSHVIMDKNQIGQVVDNIIINAKHAMPKGGTIYIIADLFHVLPEMKSSLKIGEYVKISFKDEGCGIAQSDLANIFDPFFTTKATGSGLGLSTSYSIMKRHNGLIEAHSFKGVGATFTIYLPVSKNRVEDKKPRSLEKRGVTEGSILVMDDEKVIRNTLSLLISHLGYNVIEAECGEDALDIIKGRATISPPLKLVILDLTVANGLGGLETAREITKIAPEIPLCVASGYAEDPVMADPQSFGFKSSLHKPFTISEIKAIISSSC